jgi:hypothetical protein
MGDPTAGFRYNATYGNFNQVTFTASSNTNDNACLSVYGTNNASAAASYAANPYALEQSPSYFNYLGSVTVVTQPSAAGHVPSQATPNAICAAAQSFVGKAWNMNGCWVLASNISAEAGASLPASATLAGVSGVANGEWIVAYNGPSSANANWEQSLVPGEMVGFVTTSGGGHITTVVSGSGSTAALIDNITYEYGNGTIQNTANDGSASDIIVAAAHAAMQEFNGVNPANVVVYELDTPTVRDLVASLSLAARTTTSLAPLFAVSNPLASQAITAYQVYDTNTADAITLNGVAQTADHSAAAAATVSSLATVSLLAGAATGSDTIEIRAFNGSYFGDWQGLAVNITAPSAPPTITSQTAKQSWLPGQKISLALPANTFTDPQGHALTYAAVQASGQALPSWLTFNASTRTFSGTVPAGMESLSLKVTATDTAGLSASEIFGVTVPGAPTVTSQTAGQTWNQGQKISLALPANTFTDPQGQALTYAAAQSNGQALPSWLTFNATTKTLSGTVPASVASLTLKVTATDTAGLSASENFGITVPAVTIAATTHGIAVNADLIKISAANTSAAVGANKMQYISAPAAAPQAGASHGAAVFGAATTIIQPLVPALGRVTNAAPRFDPPSSYGGNLLVNPPSLSSIIAGMAGFSRHPVPNFS